MRRTLAATVVAALSLALSLTPTLVSAATDDGTDLVPAEVGATTTADSAHDQATQALEQAKALFSGGKALGRSAYGGGSAKEKAVAPDATLVLRDLFMRLDDLDADQRKTAEAILARPTDGANDPLGNGYTVKSTKKCKSHFCVHWVTSTADAPPSQTWVNQMLNLMNKVWKKEINKLGYREPVKDGNRGGSSKFDVYLKQIGDQGLYGYCAAERQKPGFKWLASGYCVLDNDFAEFPLTPMQSAQVTAAHEFFHAIQFGYDYGEDPWLLEATATWMEERAYDDVNDNRQYLPAGQVMDPRFPLDYFNVSGSQQYGNWPFFEFLSKRYGNGVVKQIWNKAAAFKGAPDMYSTEAVTSVVKPKGGFPKVYSEFVGANLVPAKFYPEGKAWTGTALWGEYNLSSSARKTGTHGVRLLHMSSGSYKINTDSSLKSKKWSLKVKIDGPKSYRMPAAYVLVVKKGGLEKHYVKLNGQGNAQIKVPFSSKKVKSVYVSLVNASTRFKCGKSYAFSCSGYPIDDGRSFKGQKYKFSAAVVKK